MRLYFWKMAVTLPLYHLGLWLALNGILQIKNDIVISYKNVAKFIGIDLKRSFIFWEV